MGYADEPCKRLDGFLGSPVMRACGTVCMHACCVWRGSCLPPPSRSVVATTALLAIPRSILHFRPHPRPSFQRPPAPREHLPLVMVMSHRALLSTAALLLCCALASRGGAVLGLWGRAGRGQRRGGRAGPARPGPPRAFPEPRKPLRGWSRHLWGRHVGGVHCWRRGRVFTRVHECPRPTAAAPAGCGDLLVNPTDTSATARRSVCLPDAPLGKPASSTPEQHDKL